MSAAPSDPTPSSATGPTRPATLRLRRLADALAHLLDHPDIGSDEISTFVALARYCDGDGRCHPSQNTLAALLHRSRPWINARIATLCDLGLLEKTQHFLPKGGQTSCRYRIPLLAVTAPGSDGADGLSRATSQHCQPSDTAGHSHDTMNLESLKLSILSLCAPARAEPDGISFDPGDQPAVGPAVIPQHSAVPEVRDLPLRHSTEPQAPLPWAPGADDLAWAAARRSRPGRSCWCCAAACRRAPRLRRPR